jgi:hypothetical protein
VPFPGLLSLIDDMAGEDRNRPQVALPERSANGDYAAKVDVPLMLSGATEDVQHLLASDTGNGYFDLLSDLVVRIVRLSPDDAQ